MDFLRDLMTVLGMFGFLFWGYLLGYKDGREVKNDTDSKS